MQVPAKAAAKWINDGALLRIEYQLKLWNRFIETYNTSLILIK